MVVLPTVLRDANITLMGEEVNSTEVITVVSYASEATVVTPAAFACNVSILSLSFMLLLLLSRLFALHSLVLHFVASVSMHSPAHLLQVSNLQLLCITCFINVGHHC